jgi:protein-L-isoaspartate(D-aspartate) O-methyltransferase
MAACSTVSRQRQVSLNEIRSTLSSNQGLAEEPGFDAAIDAVSAVRREEFVPAPLRRMSYADSPEDIGYGETISSPYIVALMTAAAGIQPGSRVLEIGTGSGYQAAVLSRLAGQVYSIEIIEPLARAAAARLKRLRYNNVEVRAGDGFEGWPEHAPFNSILVTAGAAEPPAPLLKQLAPGGRLLMPIGPTWSQERLIVYRKDLMGALSSCVLGGAIFVPLTGKGAQPPGEMGLEDGSLAFCYGADLGRYYFDVVGSKPLRASAIRN